MIVTEKIMRRALLPVLLVVMGCSHNTLDRTTARDIINKEFSKRTERILLRIGRVGSHCQTLTEEGRTEYVDLNPATDTTSIIAHAAGYTDVVPDGNGFWKVNLTDQGRAFVDAYHVVPEAPDASSHCGYQFYALPLATAQVSDLTGIVPGETMSRAEFLWTWSLTDLGRSLRAGGKSYTALDEIHRDGLKDFLASHPGPVLPIPVPSDDELKALHSDAAQFVKYDDGWRMVVAK